MLNLRSKAFLKSKQDLNKYRKDFKKNIAKLPQNKYRDALQSMGKTIKVNKYIKALNQIK